LDPSVLFIYASRLARRSSTDGVWLAAGVGEVATAGAGIATGAGVGVGEAFVSSARERVPLVDRRTTTDPARVSERICLRQFNIVWTVI